jgi:hypothetical protein
MQRAYERVEEGMWIPATVVEVHDAAEVSLGRFAHVGVVRQEGADDLGLQTGFTPIVALGLQIGDVEQGWGMASQTTALNPYGLRQLV